MNEEERKRQLKGLNTALDEVNELFDEDRISLSAYLNVKKALDEKKVSLIGEKKTVQVKDPVVQTEQKATPVPSGKSVQESPRPKQTKPASKPTQPIRPKPAVIKKERSPEERRKRRLTYILTSGVALLLLGGVLLALTNWLVLQATTKVLMISGIALVFAGMSYLAHRLKIKQTMLAFLMLFAFFVPIVFFSISYYEILGTYLSIGGEGSMLFAALASLTCAALYAFLYSIESHRLFQIVTLLATAVTTLYTAGYIATTVEIYVLTLIIFVSAQLVLWRPLMSTSYLKAYRVYIPWFVLSQLLLASFIQVVLFNWSNLGFLNYVLLGVLYYLLAIRHADYRGLSIPAVLSLSIGITGFIVTADYIETVMYPILVLILPTALYSVWMIERRMERGAMMHVPFQIMFFVTLVFTHLFGQIMLLVDDTSPNLYFITLLGGAALLVLNGWQTRHRVTLFFSYILSFYTGWILAHFYVEELIQRSILLIIVYLAAYSVTVFVKSLNTQLLRNPIKLVAALALAVVILELATDQEWLAVTITLVIVSILASIFFTFEQVKFKTISGMAAVGALFIATISAYPAFSNASSEYPMIDWVNHFLAASAFLVGAYFVYKRIHGAFIANYSFIYGGVLYVMMLSQAVVYYSLFSRVFPELLTLHAIAGLGYTLLATLIVFKKKEWYWGVFVFSLFAYLSVLNYSFTDSALVHWTLLLLIGGIFTWLGRSMKKKTD